MLTRPSLSLIVSWQTVVILLHQFEGIVGKIEKAIKITEDLLQCVNAIDDDQIPNIRKL